MKRFWPCLFLLSTSIYAQAPSTGPEIIYHWAGEMDGDSFGDSIASAGDVNGDGTDDVIIGASRAAPGGLQSAGSAYVYSGADGTLLYQWNGDTSSLFGCSVDGAGDVNSDGYADLIVGAYYADPGGVTDAGSAFVYSGIDGSLLYQFDGELEDFSASCVSAAGDINQDGYADVIVNSNAVNPSNQLRCGAATVYSGFDGSVIHQWYGSAYQDFFGNCLADTGDIDGDGVGDLVIGAYNVDHNGYGNSGSAYVYSGLTGQLIYQFDGVAGDSFGISVSDAGDVNNDGIADVIVGSRDDLGLNDVGSAFVYSGADGSLLYRWNGWGNLDHFGWSVARAGDVNADGYADVLVGAYRMYAYQKPKAGSVFVFSGKDGSVLFQQSGPEALDSLGIQVAGVGDLNGDGQSDLLASALEGYIGGPPRPGSVYAFSYYPFISTDSTSISAASGGVINLQLDFFRAARFDQYKVLISGTGMGPSYYGVAIPLSRDPYALDTFLGNYPFSVHSGLHGTLDAVGDANASFTSPAGLPVGLVGRTFWLAAIANKPGAPPEYSSIALPIEITP